MIQIYCFLLSLGISQSLALLSNAQQELAIKPIVYKQPSNLYLPSNLQQISIDTNKQAQYQSSLPLNSGASQYNGPSYQYLPTYSTNSQYQSTSAQNYNEPSNQPQNVLSQHQSTSAQNSPSSNYNVPTNQYLPSTAPSLQRPPQNVLSQHQPSFTQNSPSSNYNVPSNQYLPSTAPSLQRPPQNVFSKHQPSFTQNSPSSNYNVPSNQYLPTSSKQEEPINPGAQRPNISIQPPKEFSQHQPSFTQNSPSSNYNVPSNQYLPTSSKQELTSLINSQRPQNGLSQSQPTFAENYNGPSSTKLDVTTTPAPPSAYYVPPYKHLPATIELTQTTTPLTSSTNNQNSENINNYTFNHYNHWNPLKDQRPQQIITNNLRPNVQPPTELHHGYRYIEPAQKVNATNFQLISGVKYNELGLVENATNTTKISQNFVQQNLPSKTEIETHQGYIYGNAQYSQHYPNTTVLKPVATLDSSYQQESVNYQQTQHPQIAISTVKQYPNHRYPTTELNSQQTYPSATTTTDNRPNEQIAKLSNSKKLTTKPSFSSQPAEFSNKVNLITNSNHLAAPQTETNRFTTEVTQQMATQIYPPLYATNQIISSNTRPNFQTVANQYYSAQVAAQENDLNRVPSGVSSLNNIQTPLNYIDNTVTQQFIPTAYPSSQYPQKPSFMPNAQTPTARPISNGLVNSQTRPNAQTQFNQFESQYSSQSIPQTNLLTFGNNVPNVQTQTNRYVSDYPASENTDYNRPSQEPLTATTSIRRPNFQTPANQLLTSSNQQKTDSQRYYVDSLPQPSQSSNFKPNVFGLTQACTHQSTYPANHSQHALQSSNFIPTVQTQTTANRNQQNTGTNYIQTTSPNYTPNSQNVYYSTNPQQSKPTPTNSITSNPIYSSSYPQQQAQNNHASYQQNENNEFPHYYYTNPQQSKGTPQTTTPSHTIPIVPTETPRFFPSTPQQSVQNSYPSRNLESSYNNVPTSQAPNNQILFTPQQSALPLPQTSPTSNQLVLNSENTENIPRFNRDKQSLYENQQFFLAKPTQTTQVPNANTVSNFFGQTSAVPSTASLSANNNGNLISQGNSNYLQMQSHSSEMPYYNTMQTANKQSQPNYAQPRSTMPVVAPVEPVRLPHLIYGTPVNEPSNTYLPPNSVITAPYF